jgi:hypothetical protein
MERSMERRMATHVGIARNLLLVTMRTSAVYAEPARPLVVGRSWKGVIMLRRTGSRGVCSAARTRSAAAK